MAVPKGKVSKARKHKRNSANFKAAATTLVECPNCKEFKEPHKVCPKCVFYKANKLLKLKRNKKNKHNCLQTTKFGGFFISCFVYKKTGVCLLELETPFL